MLPPRDRREALWFEVGGRGVQTPPLLGEGGPEPPPLSSASSNDSNMSASEKFEIMAKFAGS